MIVRKVRGKIITYVLCSIVCNNCAQCSAHTFEQTQHCYLLVRLSLSVVILCVTVHLCQIKLLGLFYVIRLFV